MSVFANYYQLVVPYSEWSGAAEIYCIDNNAFFEIRTRTVRVYAHISKVREVQRIINDKLIAA